MASDILVFGAIRGGKLKKVAKELIGTARIIAAGTGGSIDAVLIGEGAVGAAESLKEFGLRKIYISEDEILKEYSTEGYAKFLADLVQETSVGYVLFAATAQGRDLAPRVTAKVDGVMFSDCVDVRYEGDKVVAKRPVYSGKLYIEITPVGERPAFITIRPNNMPPAKPAGGSAEVVSRPAGVTADSIRALVKEIIPLAGGRPDVTEADVIVSGGRAMKDASNFKMIEELADLLGAAVGASRAAVDAGYAELALQVGQTGKIVNPKLYIACGISGAIQHLAGMRTSKVIVAINKDPNAPIFEKAHYGIVGDLFEVVPIMTEEIKKIL
ncbi:MAG: electron transfer flavoprotein subunit alpha/FixB family protein [Candidatus Krumholzibacteria bacterium]|nr:electron transfer flavoprotein subunit alpha/FixB family protein [Candidatus Krumholzibacteria bacterium]